MRETFRGKCNWLGETTAWTHCHNYEEKRDHNAENFKVVTDPEGFIYAVPVEA
jgi:hypothetical protein